MGLLRGILWFRMGWVVFGASGLKVGSGLRVKARAVGVEFGLVMKWSCHGGFGFQQVGRDLTLPWWIRVGKAGCIGVGIEYGSS